MEPIKIPFGEWLPDLPDYQNPGVTVAKNVIPAGYKNKATIDPFAAIIMIHP
jgi:hypothetical protein